MADGGGSEVKIWLKPDSFYFSILPVVNSHPKLSLKYLKYIIPYAQSKGSLGYPKLSYTVWKHIACNKLVLPEELAWTLFLTYRTLQQRRSESRIQWDDHYAKRVQDRDYLKSLLSVDTLKFTLMLYLQNYSKISLKSSSLLSISMEEWPTLDKSPLNSKSNYFRNTTRRLLKIFDEEHHLKFFEKKIVEIIELLKPKDYLNNDNHDWIPLEVIETLSFIIEGSTDNCRTIVPLHNVLLSSSVRSKLGYSNTRNEFLSDLVINWILDNLIVYPFGLSKSGINLERIMINGIQTEGGKKISSNDFAPKSHKRLIIARLNKQIIAKDSDNLRGAKLHIHRCSHSYIYILVPLRSVIITKCHDTTIVLGPVSYSINVMVGKSLRLITPCRRIVISNCTSSHFFLQTSTQPVLAGNHNNGIVLAPYNTSYPKLQDQLIDSGIGTALNLWDSPTCLNEDENYDFQMFPSKPCWDLLPPGEFYHFNIPFTLNGENNGIPGNLNEKYQATCRQQKQRVDEWHQTVENANLCQKKHNQLSKLIKDRFQRWLVLKGHQRELDSLAAYETELMSKI